MRFKISTAAAFVTIFAFWTTTASTRDSVAQTNHATASPLATVRDGSHDFDFIYGKWRMPNHRLKKRLAGSHNG